MKYCSKCGKEIMDEAVICPGCGCAQENNVPGSNLGREASSNFGWSVLGFFIPIVGLILYLVWKETSPSKAKAAGYGALSGFLLSLCVSVIAGVIAGISVFIEAVL